MTTSRRGVCVHFAYRNSGGILSSGMTLPRALTKNRRHIGNMGVTVAVGRTTPTTPTLRFDQHSGDANALGLDTLSCGRAELRTRRFSARAGMPDIPRAGRLSPTEG